MPNFIAMFVVEYCDTLISLYCNSWQSDTNLGEVQDRSDTGLLECTFMFLCCEVGLIP